MRDVDHLIVGGGPAGLACARALREGGADGSIVLVSRDPDPPYDRTACSKGYLRGDQSREQTLLAQPGWWDEQTIELLSRVSAMKLDPGREDGDALQQGDRALWRAPAGHRRERAPAAARRRAARRHPLPARARQRGRDPRDAEGAERVVLVGGSYIACEVAASLTALGLKCSIVMQEHVTLERGFGGRRAVTSRTCSRRTA